MYPQMMYPGMYPQMANPYDFQAGMMGGMGAMGGRGTKSPKIIQFLIPSLKKEEYVVEKNFTLNFNM